MHGVANRVLQGWVKNVPNDGPALLSPVSLPGVVGFFTSSTFGRAFHLSTHDESWTRGECSNDL